VRGDESSGASSEVGWENEISGNLIVLTSMRRVRRVFAGVFWDVQDVVVVCCCGSHVKW
jgi:hypothetical protein